MASSQHPLVVLLGAGASQGDAPSTADITNFLVSWDGMRAPVAGGPEDSLASEGASDTRRPLFEAVQAAYAPRTLNFEQLIHAVELLGATFAIPSPLDDARRPYLEPFVAPAPGFHDWNRQGVFARAASEACYAILDYVSGATSSNPRPPQAAALAELALRWTLRVGSLNYDDLAFRSGVSFRTGFGPDRGVGATYAPAYPWWPGDHSLVQMHGSVLFGSGGVIKRYDTLASARAGRDLRSGLPAAQDGMQTTDALMITGMRKTDKAVPPPFSDYLHAFRADLFSSPKWLIVGYGFGDLHVNAALAQAFAYWWRLDAPKLRVVVVDYHRFANGPEDAWYGTPLGDRLLEHAGRVFPPVSSFVTQRGLPKLGDVVERISREVALCYAGTQRGLGALLPDVENFLAS